MTRTNKNAAIATAVLTVFAILAGMVGLVVVGSLATGSTSAGGQDQPSHASRPGPLEIAWSATVGSQAD